MSDSSLHVRKKPSVGIFWKLGGQLLFAWTPVEALEEVDGVRGYAGAHCDKWEQWQREGKVPFDLEYDELPRGRVVFLADTNSFLLMADNCILSRRDCVSQVRRRLNLPPGRTILLKDSHYRCHHCLRVARFA